MNEKLRMFNYLDETGRIIELCEDWWELLRQDSTLFEVYVSSFFSLPFDRKSLRMIKHRKT